mmetsp:Transcript_25037/g.61726  ORF Transcript_25037/g.61726 Transcript_25037/m.61726 type:complete len:234 (+) Transcript_25037:1566-2267(+)
MEGRGYSDRSRRSSGMPHPLVAAQHMSCSAWRGGALPHIRAPRAYSALGLAGSPPRACCFSASCSDACTSGSEISSTGVAASPTGTPARASLLSLLLLLASSSMATPSMPLGGNLTTSVAVSGPPGMTATTLMGIICPRDRQRREEPGRAAAGNDTCTVCCGCCDDGPSDEHRHEGYAWSRMPPAPPPPPGAPPAALEAAAMLAAPFTLSITSSTAAAPPGMSAAASSSTASD